MARKTTTHPNLKVVNKQETPAPLPLEQDKERWERREKEHARWETAEKAALITDDEARRRVRRIREEISDCVKQLEGVPFDLVADTVPRSLDRYRREWLLTLLDNTSPIIKCLYDMINNYAEAHGCCDALDFDSKLFALKERCAETGLAIGILFGAMLVGASEREIDRLERGMVADMQANSWITK